MDHSYRNRALPHRGGDSVDRSAPNVTDGEDSPPAGFEQQRSRIIARSLIGDACTGGNGQDVSAVIERDLPTQPAGVRLGPDEDEQRPDRRERASPTGAGSAAPPSATSGRAPPSGKLLTNRISNASTNMTPRVANSPLNGAKRITGSRRTYES